ncbi:hypothetical protein C0J29_13175 [Mycobacterium paragordonae]|uniref:Arabinosyltransferase n=1 Tax=Mycobacterium paragordonae TaxID=1389713 RepID=A0ABQ1C371_9MYCO|nr:hypothetical protein [Mycobacterium paragordonae]AYE95604.1 hypothetical protein C0J29_13175 [Mycobacterium paragordonae]GFG78855.1 hypothetical protein MPRG_21310 [Mycobacterium paragordonae]
MGEARQLDTDFEASAPSGPHLSQDGARDLELSPSGERFCLTANLRQAVVRFLFAIGVSAALCFLVYRFAATGLIGPTDIVSYSTFANFNPKPQFWIYRLIVYAFPFFVIVGYVLLARFGPLRSRSPGPEKRTIELVEPAPSCPADGPSWGTPARILLPAVLVVIACGARTGHADLLAIAAGVAYVVLVTVVAEVWARRNDEQRWRAISTVNGVGGAAAAVLSLWFVSAHTVVQTPAGTRSWPWLAWWLPITGIAAIGWWSARQLRGGRAARDVELTLLTVVVGAIAVFLALSVLPGQITHFQGFDDAQEMVGASLFARGYIPWRNMQFVHGLFPDVLTGILGRVIFGDSIWGIRAIHSVILIPVFWVSVYLFAVWVSRRNPWFLAPTFLVGASVLRPLLQWTSHVSQPPGVLLQWSERFIGLPLALIVLGETLRRRSAAWAVGLTLLLFAETLLVPETIVLTAPTLACVIAAELVHRRPERSLWTNLRLTRWCVGTGLAASAVCAAFLAAHGALGGLVGLFRYYVNFGPAHYMGAAIPLSGVSLDEWTKLAVSVGCVLLTVWVVAVKVARRADWEARDWVAVAAAAFMALYVEKALGRFDIIHIWQVYAAGLPLVLLWCSRLFDRVGRLLIAWWRGRDARLIRFAAPVTAVLVLVLAVGLVCYGPLRKVDGQHHLAGATEASFPRLGYVTPGAIDTDLLRDLDTSIRTYAGDDGPVYDMTNSPGYLYFLLGRVPNTRQQRPMELTAAPPPVVIYDATSIGMPIWDGITNNVRAYGPSEYILRGWTPVLRTHGVLVMARNDLVSRRVPVLTTPPQTSGLYFSGPSCRWGASPNYLPVPDSSRATTLPVHPVTPRTVVNYSGWAVDPVTHNPAAKVLIADGQRVLGMVTPSINRPDVAYDLHQPNSASGFQFNAVVDAAVHPSAYLVGTDGLAHPFPGSPPGLVAELRLPDGSQARVVPTIAGYLEVHDVNTLVGELKLPSGMTLRDYDLAMLSSTHGPGGATVALTDQPDRPDHEISATWLDQSGSHLTVRVGSCPQWYGYDPSKPLYVMQSGGPPVTSITLSAARASA